MNARESGRAGEDMACEYLESIGFEVIGRNYHSRWGEIDIIARSDNVLVFAEVKLRRERSMVSGLEAVNASKMRKIVKTAAVWLAGNPTSLPVRFDVIEIKTRAGSGSSISCAAVEHIQSAFGAEVCDEIF